MSLFRSGPQALFYLTFPLFLLMACASTEPLSESGENDEALESTSNNGATTAVTATRIPADAYSNYNIVTLLPRDAIPAIDNPTFMTAAMADDSYEPDELVIGVEFNGEARAYSVPLLSQHEIVNDEVGGVKIAVTW